jgi:hypothetical protein
MVFCYYCKALCFCGFNSKKGNSIGIAEADESRGTKLRSDPGLTLSALSMAFILERDWGLLIEYCIIGNRGRKECRDNVFDGHEISERKNVRSDVDLGDPSPCQKQNFLP